MGTRGEFRAVYGSIWTGDTGRQIKAAGKEAQILALYLVTCSHSNMIGVYHLPLAYAAYDTGLTLDEIAAARQVLEGLTFAVYDDASEWVFVVNGYGYQCADAEGRLPSKAADKRLVGALALFRQVPGSLQARFAQRYGSPFEAPSKPLPTPIEPPSKPVPSTEPRPEPVQNHTQNGAGAPARVCGPSEAANPEHEPPTDTAGEAWNDWRDAWGQNARRRPLPLVPVNGDQPRLAEIGRRYPDQAHRRALMAAYFTSRHKPLLEKPYSIGMFLYWSTWLDENEPTLRRPAPANELTTWDRIVERLGLRLNQHEIYTWLKPLVVLHEDGATLTVSGAEAGFVERHWRPWLDAAAEEVRAGLHVRLVEGEKARLSA